MILDYGKQVLEALKKLENHRSVFCQSLVEAVILKEKCFNRIKGKTTADDETFKD